MQVEVEKAIRVPLGETGEIDAEVVPHDDEDCDGDVDKADPIGKLDPDGNVDDVGNEDTIEQLMLRIPGPLAHEQTAVAADKTRAMSAVSQDERTQGVTSDCSSA
jgi:hypothetical protein